LGFSGLPEDYQSEQLWFPAMPKRTFLFDLASGVVYLASNVTIEAVGSYPAFSPLPGIYREVYFLWHLQ